jgi:trans-aconitate 2-methyltransferase
MCYLYFFITGGSIRMSQNVQRQEISDFYGTFCEEEKNLRLNIRHYTVFQHLVRAGLKKDHRVLEIGCGFGTITSLMARYLKRGSIVATDISAERIASCERNFKDHKHVSFVLTDMTDFHPKEKFDFVVLPDVLEHIPLEAHHALFGLIAAVLKEDGTVMIHIPHPLAIEYLRKHNPAGLQIIDQSVHSDHLTAVTYPHGLVLHTLNSYTLGSEQPDYQIIAIKKHRPYTAMPPLKASNIQWRKALARFYFWRKRVF